MIADRRAVAILGLGEGAAGERASPQHVEEIGAWPRARSPAPADRPPSGWRSAPRVAAMSLKTWLRCFQSKKLAGAGVLRGKLAALLSSQTMTTRSGSANGSGRSSTASTVEKIAVLAPIPRASAPTATAVNPGEWRSSRSAVT